MNIILFIFIVLASAFIAGSTNNIVSVATALDSYFEKAEVPDYWTAISNEKDLERFYAFAEENGYAYKNIELLMIPNNEITADGRELAYSNSITLCTTEDTIIFDSNGEQITEIQDGEIYVTADVFFGEGNDFHEGSKLHITANGTDKEFTVKGYTKDALFGLHTAGITRLLVSENDFNDFRKEHSGSTYSLEIYTDDTEFLDKFNRLELNILFLSDYDTIKQLYFLEMLVAAIIFVVSICLIIISMVLLHFTIHFTISEEFREIGVMKSIGIPNGTVRGQYILKYLAVSVVGAALGLVLSVPFSKLLLADISRKILIAEDRSILLNMTCAAATAFAVVLFCWFCTRKIRHFSPIDAIRNGETGERYTRKGLIHLNKSKLPPVFFMTVNDIFSGLKKYVSMLVIFTLGILLVLLPANTVNTLRSDSLMKLFSMAESDLVISQENRFSADTDVRKEIDAKLENVDRILEENNIKADVFQEVVFRTSITYNGKKISSLAFIGIGDVTADMYSYIEGTPPQKTGEVAITHVVAKKIGAQIGDEVEINLGNETRTYTVTAINQTMNNMGEGIRFYQEEELDFNNAFGNFGIQIRYTDNPDTETKINRQTLLDSLFSDDVLTASDYIIDMMGDFAGQISDVKNLILTVVLCINMLVAVLMVKSFLTKEKSEIAILKAIGFQNTSLVLWQTLRIGLILLIAVIFGTLVSAPLSKLIIGPIFQAMGLYTIQFEISAVENYVIYPLLVLAATSLSAFLSALGLQKIPASEASNIE